MGCCEQKVLKGDDGRDNGRDVVCLSKDVIEKSLFCNGQITVLAEYKHWFRKTGTMSKIVILS